jgi:hypothetical protein
MHNRLHTREAVVHWKQIDGFIEPNWEKVAAPGDCRIEPDWRPAAERKSLHNSMSHVFRGEHRKPSPQAYLIASSAAGPTTGIAAAFR